ncbi:hypothetical protein ABH926_000557 [Catenulispora sp. GP43]
MTGTEPLDREPAEDAGPEYRDDAPVYRDRLGAVSEARPMSRPALLAAVVAVCGTGLLAGLGLFGGSTPRSRPPAPAPVVVKAADTLGPRSGEPVHERPAHQLHPRHLPKHVPRSLYAVHQGAHEAAYEAVHGTARRTHNRTNNWTHKGSGGGAAPPPPPPPPPPPLPGPGRAQAL